LGIEFDIQFQKELSSVTPEMAQAAATRYFIEPYVSLVGPAEAINWLEKSVI
jgi:predicted Zn-dependent peptidase